MSAIITTPSQMISDVGSDFFTDEVATEAAGAGEGDDLGDVGAADATATEPPGEGGTEGQTEGTEGTEGTEETQEGTEEPEPAEGTEPAEGQEGQTQQTQAEQLPFGVRKMKDRAGKEGFFVEPNVWKDYEGHGTFVTEGSNLIGEPLTMDALKMRENAFTSMDRMYNDFMSADPKSQQRFLSEWARDAREAIEAGEISADPFIPFAKEFYSNLEQISPDAYAGLRLQSAQDLVNEMYQLSAETKNQMLFNSAGHVAKALGLEFKPGAKMQEFFDTAGKKDPNQDLINENRSLRDQLNTRSASDARTVMEQFTTDTSRLVNDAILADVIRPTFADLETAWDKLPNGPQAFQDLVVKRSNDLILETIKKDSKFNEKISRLDSNAARAASREIRERVAQQIKQEFINRAKLIIQAKKHEYNTFAVDKFKEQSQQGHARRAAAQTQRGTKGVGSPTVKSAVPGSTVNTSEGKFFNPNVAAREAAQLIREM